MNHEEFARWLHVELHIDIPGSREAVRYAVLNAMGGEDGLDVRPSDATMHRIADDIEDRLGYRGEQLRYWLNEAAMEGWREQVASAAWKVLRRDGVSGSG